jgi:hypothetical protein
MKGVLRNFAEDVAAGKFVRLGTKNERKMSLAWSQCEFFSAMPANNCPSRSETDTESCKSRLNGETRASILSEAASPVGEIAKPGTLRRSFQSGHYSAHRHDPITSGHHAITCTQFPEECRLPTAAVRRRICLS